MMNTQRMKINPELVGDYDLWYDVDELNDPSTVLRNARPLAHDANVSYIDMYVRKDDGERVAPTREIIEVDLQEFYAYDSFTVPTHILITAEEFENLGL